MVCYFCDRNVARDELNYHHPTPKSEGGVDTVPAHKSCHIAYHIREGHFRAWGKLGGQFSAITRHWAFTLKNVKDNPAFEMDRQFYRMFYASA